MPEIPLRSAHSFLAQVLVIATFAAPKSAHSADDIPATTLVRPVVVRDAEIVNCGVATRPSKYQSLVKRAGWPRKPPDINFRKNGVVIIAPGITEESSGLRLHSILANSATGDLTVKWKFTRLVITTRTVRSGGGDGIDLRASAYCIDKENLDKADLINALNDSVSKVEPEGDAGDVDGLCNVKTKFSEGHVYFSEKEGDYSFDFMDETEPSEEARYLSEQDSMYYSSNLSPAGTDTLSEASVASSVTSSYMTNEKPLRERKELLIVSIPKEQLKGSTTCQYVANEIE